MLDDTFKIAFHPSDKRRKKLATIIPGRYLGEGAFDVQIPKGYTDHDGKITISHITRQQIKDYHDQLISSNVWVFTPPSLRRDYKQEAGV